MSTTTKATKKPVSRKVKKSGFVLTPEQKEKYIAEFRQKMEALALRSQTINHNKAMEKPVNLTKLSKPTIGSKFAFLADLSVNLKKAGK